LGAHPYGDAVVRYRDLGDNLMFLSAINFYCGSSGRDPAGARVFAAGAFTLAGSATRPHGSQLLDNLWHHLTYG
jgi:hypothetical protein